MRTTNDILEELDRGKGDTTKSATNGEEGAQVRTARKAYMNNHTPRQTVAFLKGGKRANTNPEHPLLCQQVNSKTGLYMEMQQRKFCQLHALNALFGRNIVQPQTMLDFCATETKTDTSLGRTLKNGGYCPYNRNFPDMAINAWLHHNCQPRARLKCIEEGIPCSSFEAAFTSCLPPHTDAFILRWNQGRQAHEDAGYGHAVCIRRHPVTKDWYLTQRIREQEV